MGPETQRDSATSIASSVRTVALFSAGLVLLTACGGGAGASGAKPGPADGYPVTLKNCGHTVTAEAAPRRPGGPGVGRDPALPRSREALARTGLADRADQSWHTLSGGERQRVQIARALAQQPRELLLDEPTNHLDIQHQLELLALIASLPLTGVIALHDLNLAAMFCDRIAVLKEGRVVAAGTPTEVITEELIADVYRVAARVTPEGPDGRPSVRFLPGRPAGT